jgi:hypothetical protein
VGGALGEAVQVKTKECGRCKESKELSTDYFPRNSRSKDGFDSYCKECWRLRSREKSKRGADGHGAARARVSAKAVAKPWARRAKAAPGPELAPEDVRVVPVAKLSDLPKMSTFLEMSGSTLAEAIAEFTGRVGRRPQVVYTPARFFMEYPADHELLPVAASATEGRSKAARVKTGGAPARKRRK